MNDETDLALQIDQANTVATKPASRPASKPTVSSLAVTREEAASSEMVHEEGCFSGEGGVKLFEQWWLPPNPKAAVALVHGYAEHSGRYDHVAETLCANGYAVYGYDSRSHGKSEGVDTYINSYEEVVADLGHFMQQIAPRVGQLPLFILGHSIGGLITSLYMSSLYMSNRRAPVKGVVLSGPYVSIADNIPNWLVPISDILGTLVPKLPTIGVSYEYVSRDPEMLAQHDADSLIFRGKVPARTGASYNRGVAKIQQEAYKITAPLLILHGGDDRIATLEGSQAFYKQVSSVDKTFKVYDGFYHEILNEIDRAQVKTDIIEWMDAHYATK